MCKYIERESKKSEMISVKGEKRPISLVGRFYFHGGRMLDSCIKIIPFCWRTCFEHKLNARSNEVCDSPF